MRTDELIADLARRVTPVRPLPSPYVRLARWTAIAIPVMAVGVLVAGPRADILLAIQRPAFVALAAATLATALLSAATAFVLSVPGAERSRLRRLLPLLAAGAWAGLLLAQLTPETDGLRFAQLFHWACALQITGFAVVSGWALFVMLRRAAPLDQAWTAAFAALAAVALAAVATQVLCPIDNPRHHLVGHLLPAGVLVIVGVLAGRGALDWLALKPDAS